MEVAWYEKKRQMPKSPEQSDDQTGRECTILFLQPGKEESPPPKFFSSHTEEQDIQEYHGNKVPLSRVVGIHHFSPINRYIPNDSTIAPNVLKRLNTYQKMCTFQIRTLANSSFRPLLPLVIPVIRRAEIVGPKLPRPFIHP